jgi:hypothetical protein
MLCSKPVRVQSNPKGAALRLMPHLPTFVSRQGFPLPFPRHLFKIISSIFVTFTPPLFTKGPMYPHCFPKKLSHPPPVIRPSSIVRRPPSSP